MSPAITRLLVYVGLAVAVIGVALVFQHLLVIVISAAVAAVVAILVHRALGGEGSEQRDSVIETPDSTDAWIGHLRSLVRMNIQIRENALPAEVVEKLEHAIDSLRALIPELNDEYLGSELTWTVNRMATDYLPRILSPYVALAPAGRVEHQAELFKSLAGLETELSNIGDLVRNAKVGEFKTKAAFLRARFLDPGLG